MVVVVAGGGDAAAVGDAAAGDAEWAVSWRSPLVKRSGWPAEVVAASADGVVAADGDAVAGEMHVTRPPLHSRRIYPKDMSKLYYAP